MQISIAGDSAHFCLSPCRIFSVTPGRKAAQSSGVAKSNSSRGTNGWPRRHRNYPCRPSVWSRFRRNVSSTCAGPLLWWSTRCNVCVRNAKAGRLRLFEALSGHLASERVDVSYASLASSLGIAEAMVKKQLHNLRQRSRWLLRDEVAHTVKNAADVDDEIRYLCAVLAADEFS